MSGNTIPSSSIALHGSGPLPFLLALRRPGRCIPSLSSMISHGLAGSFQPFQAFNDFQKHGDPSHGSHDEASQPISGGRRQSTAHPRVRSEPMFPAKPAARPWN